MTQYFNDLIAFKDWWLTTRIINSPPEGALHYQKTSTGVVLFREGCYQVELFLMKPSAQLVGHVHPNVDAFEVYLTGDVHFNIDGKKQMGQVIKVDNDTNHSGHVGETGGAFLSIQKWLNGVPPTSVTLDWYGDDGSENSQESKSTVLTKYMG